MADSKEWNGLTFKEAARRFVLEKGFSVPSLLIAFFTFCLGVGLFSTLVAAEKFRELCDLYKIIFPAWAAGGIANKWVSSKPDGGSPSA